MRGLTRAYVIRRLGMFVLTVWLGSTIIFIIPRLVPGDPVSAMIGERVRSDPLSLLLEVVAGGLVLFGVWTLARSPTVTGGRGRVEAKVSSTVTRAKR